jgi:protein-tyrosine phosphatase
MTAAASSSFYLYMDEIQPRLFLGSEDALEAHLEEAKITHVLSLREPEYEWKQDQMPKQCMHRVIVIEDDESENMMLYFIRTHQWIQSTLQLNPNTRFLVHCRAGISRSATIVAHHLMQSQGISDDKALTIINEKRQVDPNHGFRWQLRIQSCIMNHLHHPDLTRIIESLPDSLSDDLYLVSIIFASLFPSQ